MPETNGTDAIPIPHAESLSIGSSGPILRAAPDIRAAFREAAAQIEPFETCAFLDYPDYFNIGDHLIWLGILHWLTQTRSAKIRYVSSLHGFSARKMERLHPDGPLILTGGGNLGDLWTPHQRFREEIIARYPDRRIIIMPQSIYFTRGAGRDAASKVFNAHPHLTLFARDDISWQTAKELFPRCRIHRAPDAAFELAGSPLFDDPDSRRISQKPVLFHCRDDKECSGGRVRLPPGVVQRDWDSLTPRTRFLQKLVRHMPSLWEAAALWVSGPEADGNGSSGESEFIESLSRLPAAPLHLCSLALAKMGIRQFLRHRTVVTARLHGHILSVLMGKPNILLPNSYHKNESFYRTWTSQIPYARFTSNLQTADLES